MHNQRTNLVKKTKKKKKELIRWLTTENFPVLAYPSAALVSIQMVCLRPIWITTIILLLIRCFFFRKGLHQPYAVVAKPTWAKITWGCVCRPDSMQPIKFFFGFLLLYYKISSRLIGQTSDVFLRGHLLLCCWLFHEVVCSFFFYPNNCINSITFQLFLRKSRFQLQFSLFQAIISIVDSGL